MTAVDPTAPAGPTRTETDSMGPVEVPADHYWGAQTQRSLHHFAISRDTMPIPIIHAFGILKRAAAEVNADLGLLPVEARDLVVRAAIEVSDGSLAA
jgi:fumarate hydratase class II